MGFLPRKPDFIIGAPNDPYLRRWYLIRTRWFEVMLHQILHDDDDRALHDHPWDNVSLLLKGAYAEVRYPCDSPSKATILNGGDHSAWIRLAWTLTFRRAETPHRLVVLAGPVWSLVFCGKRRREWGFWCPQGWRPWREFVDSRDRGRIGRGCE